MLQMIIIDDHLKIKKNQLSNIWFNSLIKELSLVQH